MSSSCQRLHEVLRGAHRFDSNFRPNELPPRGLYVMFERSETGHGGERIVRVGTHTGGGKIHQRLAEHYIKQNKDRSIFRKHVGRALLHRTNDAFITQWNLDRTASAVKAGDGRLVDPGKLAAVEEQVTHWIREHMTFVVLAVPAKTDRLTIEASLLGTVAHCGQCGPSSDWLGRHHPDPRIARSGLWNVQRLNSPPLSSPDDVETLAQCVVTDSEHRPSAQGSG